MYEEMLSKANVQFDQALEPARKFNSVVVDNLEKVARVNFEAAKSYADLTMKEVREALSIEDAQGLQKYLSSRGDVAKSVADRVKADSEKLAGINQDFVKEIQKLVEENMKAFSVEAPKAARKPAAPKAAPAAAKTAEAE